MEDLKRGREPTRKRRPWGPETRDGIASRVLEVDQVSHKQVVNSRKQKFIRIGLSERREELEDEAVEEYIAGIRGLYER